MNEASISLGVLQGTPTRSIHGGGSNKKHAAGGDVNNQGGESNGEDIDISAFNKALIDAMFGLGQGDTIISRRQRHQEQLTFQIKAVKMRLNCGVPVK